MAVQSDTSRISYAGNNSTSTSYAVPFVFLENAHLKAIAKTSAGVETVVTLTNHTGAGDVNGGTVRTSVAIPATSTLTIYRDVPITQTTTYAEGGDFPAASHERALDKLTQISQQNARQIGSSIRFSEATQLNPVNPPVSATPHVLTTVNGAAPTWETVPSVSTSLNIPSLTDTSTVGPSDELIVQQSGLPRRATASELLNGTATVTSTGSTTGRTLANRFADTVNVKDFGAVGNGVADDTAAIQAAIGSNKVVYFPRGTYIVTSGISLTNSNNFALVGESKHASIIKLSASATFSADILAFYSCSQFSISGLQFKWNNNTSSQSFALLRIQSSNNFTVSDCIIEHNSAPIGFYIESCHAFWIDRNVIKRFSQSSATNYNINVSSNISTATNGVISNNYIENSGIGLFGKNITITDNYCLNNKYGANIVTFAQGAGFSGSFFGKYVVTGNHCIGSTGTDADGFLCSGMEIAGAYSVVSNNVVCDNDGEGIRLFAYQSICSNNIVYNNGKGGGANETRCGILACWADPSLVGGNVTYSANYSIIHGNQCFDTGGIDQLYGYGESSISITGVRVVDNDFAGSATAPLLLKSTTGNSYELDHWFSYAPVIAAATGSLTAGTCTGHYMRKGKFVFFQASCAIANNGTGASFSTITLPIPASAGAITTAASGKAIVSGKLLSGQIGPTSTTVNLVAYDGTYAGATGETLIVSGWYQI
jgi:hypothetical protein